MAAISRSSGDDKSKFQELISELNRSVLTVRNKNQLITVIENQITGLLGFDDIIISLANHESRMHTNFINYAVHGHCGQSPTLLDSASLTWNYNDDFYKITLTSDGPIVWDLAEITEGERLPPFLINLVRNDFKKILGVSLPSPKGSLGCVFFFSLQPNAFSEIECELAFEISKVLSGTLNNILFVEELERRERDKGHLLQLCADIASVRKLDELMNIAADGLRRAFQFNDFIIPILNEDYITHKICFSYFEKHYEISNENAHEIKKEMCCSKDGIIDIAMEAHYPVVWNVVDILKWASVPLYVRIWSDNNICKIAGLPIRSKGRSIGAILFSSDSNQAFLANDLSRMNVLTNYLSSAILNILADEDLKKLEYEREILLSVGNIIATIRDKKDLLQIMINKLRPLLHFKDFLMATLGTDRQLHEVFCFDLDDTEIDYDDLKRILRFLKINGKDMISDIMQSDMPVFNRFEIQSNELPGNKISQFYKELGVNEIAGMAIRNGGEEIGVLFLSFREAGDFSQEKIMLLKSFFSQLCTVISNVIANEIILEREVEVSFLLSLSNEISTIRDRAKLMDALDSKLKIFVPSVKVGIFVFDKNNECFSDFFVSENTTKAESFLAKHFFSNSLIKELKLLASSHPGLVKVSIRQLIQKDLIELDFALNHKQIVTVALKNSSQEESEIYLVITSECFFSDGNYGVLQGIADQLSIAVSNILANEENLKRDRDIHLLLELSKSIAKVRDKDDLHEIVKKRITTILNFDLAAIIKFNEDIETGKVYLMITADQSDRGRTFDEIISMPISLKRDVFETVFLDNAPIVYHLEEGLESIGDSLFLKLVKMEINAKACVVVPVYEGNRVKAICMGFSAERYPENIYQLKLLRSFSTQLSIAMANIEANEKNELQIQEIANFRQQLEEENLYLLEEIQTSHNYSELIGGSEAMHHVVKLISLVSETQSSVLLLGETGTGKELIARAIHNNSNRKGRVMVKVNCATLPANLIESELFGHERGSFTGATDKRIGKFELANNSTLFLDEIGEIPLDLQAKLLRALQEKEIERVGGRTVIKTDVRIIAATNRDLAQEVRIGNFRSDLFFRLNVFPITLPPLRERMEDIPLLATHFLEKYSKKSNKKVMGFSNTAIKEMLAYNWPGNVRELEHLVERTILMTAQSTINHLHLPVYKTNDTNNSLHQGRFKTIDEIEREHIMAILKSCRGKVGGVGGAAEILKLPPTTVHSKMKRLGIGKKFSTNR